MEELEMFQKGSGRAASRGAAGTKLHSVHGLLREREIAGKIEAGGRTHEFAFSPSSVAVANGRIELTGAFAVGPPAGRTGRRAALQNVRATLASTQGGIGQAPRVRRELLAQTAQGAETAKPDVAEPAQPPPGDAAPVAALPKTEATGPEGFVGVMYLKLSPLDARALGVAADMSGVQLNTRLAPTSETERELHWLFSGLVAAVHGERPDARAASAHVDAINGILKG
jgi:hypothetical protein